MNLSNFDDISGWIAVWIIQSSWNNIEEDSFSIVDYIASKIMFIGSILISFIMVGLCIGNLKLLIITSIFINLFLQKYNTFHARHSHCLVLSTYIVFISSLMSYNLYIRFGDFICSEWIIGCIVGYITVRIVTMKWFVKIMQFIDSEILN